MFPKCRLSLGPTFSNQPATEETPPEAVVVMEAGWLLVRGKEMAQTKVPRSTLTWWVVVIVKRLDSRVLPALVVSNNLIIPEFEKEN